MLSIFDCKKVLSAFFAISPPNASISLTKCPFDVPPILGLHGIFASVSKLITKAAVFFPILAAASAASQPACPAPITTTSYVPKVYSLIFSSYFPKQNFSNIFEIISSVTSAPIISPSVFVAFFT